MSVRDPAEPTGPDPHESLDPTDWEAMRALAHRMVDDAFEDVRALGDRPAWQPVPEGHEAKFAAPLPREGRGAEEAYRAYREDVAPYRMGNDHPRFWAFYMGSGNVLGALSEFLAAMHATNMGGGAHAAGLVELQVVDWCREMVGLPPGSSGLLTSGASMANLVGLTVARHERAGGDVRRDGVASLEAPLRVYASSEVHACHARALELLGLGSDSLRKVPCDADYRMDVAALEARIEEDRRRGERPLAVVGTAGTINTGAVDDLPAIAETCAREGVWFHVDAAIGAPVALAPANAYLVGGMERADSVALDLHKWMHAPFEAGMVLVRDAEAHRAAFAQTPAYLRHASTRGVAAGTWFSDYGPQLTRGFKALKVWMSLIEHGADRFGRLVDRDIARARDLAARIDALPDFERLAPVELDVVCFRARPDGVDGADADAFNRELLLRLHESGVAVPSHTTLQGHYCLRVAFCNHRTRDEDVGVFLQALQHVARELRDEPRAWRAEA